VQIETPGDWVKKNPEDKWGTWDESAVRSTTYWFCPDPT